MDYRRTGPISAYPNEYHGDPFFGDPSPELDQGWIDHLKCKRASSTSVLSLKVSKMPRYAFTQENTRTIIRAVSFLVTDLDTSPSQPRIMTYTASDSSTRMSTRITTSPTTRKRRSLVETLTPVLYALDLWLHSCRLTT